MFRWETELVDAFVQSEPWRLVEKDGWKSVVAREVDGYFGVPDVMIGLIGQSRSGARLTRSFAFEAKLRDWRKALVQAYRYRAFSEYSYVVLDEAKAQAAVENLDLFERSSVGLVTVSVDGATDVIFSPPFARPYCSRLRQRLRKELLETLDFDVISRFTGINHYRSACTCHHEIPSYGRHDWTIGIECTV